MNYKLIDDDLRNQLLKDKNGLDPQAQFEQWAPPELTRDEELAPGPDPLNQPPLALTGPLKDVRPAGPDEDEERAAFYESLKSQPGVGGSGSLSDTQKEQGGGFDLGKVGGWLKGAAKTVASPFARDSDTPIDTEGIRAKLYYAALGKPIPEQEFMRDHQLALAGIKKAPGAGKGGIAGAAPALAAALISTYKLKDPQQIADITRMGELGDLESLQKFQTSLGAVTRDENSDLTRGLLAQRDADRNAYRQEQLHRQDLKFDQNERRFAAQVEQHKNKEDAEGWKAVRDYSTKPHVKPVRHMVSALESVDTDFQQMINDPEVRQTLEAHLGGDFNYYDIRSLFSALTNEGIASRLDQALSQNPSYTRFQQSVTNTMNQALKEMSGAAVTGTEWERFKNAKGTSGWHNLSSTLHGIDSMKKDAFDILRDEQYGMYASPSTRRAFNTWSQGANATFMNPMFEQYLKEDVENGTMNMNLDAVEGPDYSGLSPYLKPNTQERAPATSYTPTTRTPAMTDPMAAIQQAKNGGPQGAPAKLDVGTQIQEPSADDQIAQDLQHVPDDKTVEIRGVKMTAGDWKRAFQAKKNPQAAPASAPRAQPAGPQAGGFLDKAKEAVTGLVSSVTGGGSKTFKTPQKPGSVVTLKNGTKWKIGDDGLTGTEVK